VSVVLLRVDERLVHGQVTVGWGMRLRPARYVVVDDDLAEAEWEQDLFRLGVPAESEVEFIAVEEARSRFQDWDGAASPTVLLTRDLEHMLRLARGGVLEGREVNLGGIHHAPGRDRVLPYLFLSTEDRDRIRDLLAEGVRVEARDLPDAPRTRAGNLLS
jgi:mannose/fructose/N-acetylgalactosamine-specific phosphotransferase system component IIB